MKRLKTPCPKCGAKFLYNDLDGLACFCGFHTWARAVKASLRLGDSGGYRDDRSPWETTVLARRRDTGQEEAEPEIVPHG